MLYLYPRIYGDTGRWFPVYEGQHEGIVSEEDWSFAQVKRNRTGVRKEKAGKSGYVSLLSTVIKCRCCGKSMYSNPKRPSGKDTKTRYYYYCKNTGTATGREGGFRTNIEQSEIDNFVAGVISAMVHNPQFEKAIKDKIGTVVDTTDMQKELEIYRQQLRQILTTKARLEKQMDSLDVTDPHYDRKIIDLQRRYDAQYDIMGEVEGHIDELEEQILAIRKSRYPEIMYISSCWPLMNSMRNLRTSRNAMCFELSSREWTYIRRNVRTVAV